MAFTFPTANQNFGFGIGETEEERRRREEQERMQREQMAAMQAQQQAEIQAQQERDRLEAEQRAQQQAMEQPGQAVAQIPAGMADPNPYGSAIAQGQSTEGPAPTQGGPVSPDQANIEEQRSLQQAALQAQQQAQEQQAALQAQTAQAAQAQPAPAAMDTTQGAGAIGQRMAEAAARLQARAAQAQPAQPAPAVPEVSQAAQPAAPVAPVQLPQPGPGVQVASTAPGAGVAEAAQAAQPSVSVGSLQEVAQQQVTPTFESRFTEASNDITKLEQLRKDETLTKEQRLLAGRQAQDLLTKELGPIRAKEEIANMSEVQIAQLLKSKKEEGSWGKLLLLGFISPALAAKEAAKLGLNDQWTTSTTTDGTPVLLKTRDGVPIEGVNGTTGKSLSPKELVAAAAAATAAKGTEVGADTFADPTGVVKGNWVLERKAGQSVYRQVGTNRVATPEEANSLRKIGVQGTLGDQRARLIQEMNIRLQGKAGEEAMAIQRQYNQLLVSQGFPPLQPSDTPITAPQIGGAAPAAPAPAPAAPAPAAISPEQSARLQGDLRSLDSELSRIPAGDSRRQVIETERNKVLQQLGMPAAAAPVPTGRPGTGLGGRPTGQALEAQGAAGTAAATESAKTAPLIARADQEAFVKFKNDELLPKADTGSRLAGIRRDQISGPDGVLNNPEIAGLLSGTGSQAREFQNLFRDIVGGSFDKIDDMSTRIKQANLDPKMKQVLQIQLQRQREVTPLLIREVAPVGAITDFEQRMAKEAGIDVLRQGLYASLTNLTRSQFQSDMTAYKAVFAERNPQLRTRAEFDRAWNAEKARLDASYRKVYEDRAKYIGQYNRDGSNNNATIVAFKDHYPVPTFDASTGQFRFSGYSRQAERPPLSSFERR